jgi:hypothetical protein
MTSGDIFVCLIAGLAVPLAILDVAKAILDDGLPEQGDGLQFERRLAPWLLGLLAGPALLFERIAEGWREKSIPAVDIVSGTIITVGWAAVYGFVLVKSAQLLGT